MMTRLLRLLLCLTGILATIACTTTVEAVPRQQVLLEHCTNASCPPCAAYNPALHAAMNAMTRDSVIKISYHAWWPGPSDPFYQWNISENTGRINYYGVDAVPDGKVDGTTTLALPFNQTAIRAQVRARYGTASPCTIEINANVTGTTGVYFAGTITAESSITGRSLYVALIEDVVSYATPPGTNGETVFPDPLRDMYPNASSGETITASPGNPYNFSGTLNRSASWNPDNLTVVAWVQNNTTHEVLQATWVEVTQFTLNSPNGGEVWTYPETHAITWVSGFAGGGLRVELNRNYPGGAWEEIFANTADDGTEDWTLTGPASTNCRMRITSLSNPSLTDISNTAFTIRVPSIQIVSPNGGEEVNGELPRVIQWTSTAITGNVLIELNRDYPNGDWEVMGTVPNSNTSLVLGVPITQHARLRLTSVNEPFASDESDGDFTIFVVDVPPTLKHDAHADSHPGDITFVAELTDDRSIPDGVLHFRQAGASVFDEIAMIQTANPNEYAATLTLTDGQYEYFIEVLDSADQSVNSDVMSFDVGDCGTAMVFDDGTAEGYDWANEIEFEWAILVDPLVYPYVLCGAEVAIAATRPGNTHSPFMVRVLDTDGVAGLPGSVLWSDTTGSIGNVVGGVQPGSVHWCPVVIDNFGSAPLLFNEPFYLAVSNPVDRKYEAFGRDDNTVAGNSFFFDGCELEWRSEQEADPNAHGGTRMIRAVGYTLSAPTNLVIISDGVDIVLTWVGSGAPHYRVYSATTLDGFFPDFIGSTQLTTIRDLNAAATGEVKFYRIVASTTP